MIEAARKYVAQTLLQLPNLFALRTTNRTMTVPIGQERQLAGSRGLHLVNASRREISIFDERTNQSPNPSSSNSQEQTGLVSGGEFGSTLSMILSDTINGQVTWSHWEKSPTGHSQSSTIRFQVPLRILRSSTRFRGRLRLRARQRLSSAPAGFQASI